MRVLPLAALPAMIFPTLLSPAHVEPREPMAASAMPAPKAVERPVSPMETILSKAAPTAAPAPAAPAVDEQDLRCLALNIYHEARSEPESGQIAVALVTLNRVASKAFPGSICDVVKQGGVKRNRCQFSWWCDGRSDQPTEKRAWRRSLKIARRVLDDAVPDPTKGALYYHASYCSPSWSGAFHRTTRIGRHLFYRPTRI